jgi:hypothetical protein
MFGTLGSAAAISANDPAADITAEVARLFDAEKHEPSRTLAGTGRSGFLFVVLLAVLLAVLAVLRATDDLGHKALGEAGDETPEE